MEYLLLLIVGCAVLTAAVPMTTETVQRVPEDTYIPHMSYPYAEMYPNSAFEGYLVPAGPYPNDYMKSVMPVAQTALQVALRTLTKFGMFLVGGIAALFAGGALTTAICSLTPICTITFNGFKDISKETVRSYVNKDSLSAAAGFVNDAIGKYERLQNSGGK